MSPFLIPHDHLPVEILPTYAIYSSLRCLDCRTQEPASHPPRGFLIFFKSFFFFFFSVANMHRKVSCQGTRLNGRSERTALAWLSLFKAAWWIVSLVILSVWGSNKPGDPVGAPKERLHLNQSRGAESMIYDTVAPAAALLLLCDWLADRSRSRAKRSLPAERLQQRRCHRPVLIYLIDCKANPCITPCVLSLHLRSQKELWGNGTVWLYWCPLLLFWSFVKGIFCFQTTFGLLLFVIRLVQMRQMFLKLLVLCS